jgi:hypothetical protein
MFADARWPRARGSKNILLLMMAGITADVRWPPRGNEEFIALVS